MGRIERGIDPAVGAARMSEGFGEASSTTEPRALEFFYGNLDQYGRMIPHEVVEEISAKIGRITFAESCTLFVAARDIRDGATYGVNGANYRDGEYFEIVDAVEAGE